jgi:adenosylmethionine-8-amino-7-oxononanoate aminotransferase
MPAIKVGKWREARHAADPIFPDFSFRFDAGLLIRATADILALSPPLFLEKPHVDEIVGQIGKLFETIV